MYVYTEIKTLTNMHKQWHKDELLYISRKECVFSKSQKINLLANNKNRSGDD